MKPRFTVYIVTILLLLSACLPTTSTASPVLLQPVDVPTVNAVATAMPMQITPEASTVLPGSNLPTMPASTDSVGMPPVPGGPPSGDAITLADNGSTFTMQVGDTVLLNLGIDTYDWNVNIDNQAVLHLKVGVMVIRGAQGLYEALRPGTAILAAAGNPLCLQNKPPCARPSILFRVTIIVQ